MQLSDLFFPALEKCCTYGDGGLSMAEDITYTSTTPFKHPLAVFTTHGVWQYQKRLRQLENLCGVQTVKLQDIRMIYFS